MKEPYVIVFEQISDKTKKEEFAELIRSNFISKKGTSFSFIISAQDVKQTKEIFDIIESKLSFKADFFVVEMNNFYGNFYPDALTWMYEQFPSSNFINRPKKDPDDDKPK